MKRYRIMNRAAKQWWEGEADSALEACRKAGWSAEDCWVREYVFPHPYPTNPGGYHGGGWKKPDDVPEPGIKEKKESREKEKLKEKRGG